MIPHPAVAGPDSAAGASPARDVAPEASGRGRVARFQIAASGSAAKYALRSRAEIVGVLRSLIEHHELVTLYFDDTNEFAVTSLLAVDPAADRLVFDLAALKTANRRIVDATTLLLESSRDRIRIQFATGRAREIDFEGAPAFATPIPGTLLRFQRREYYRLVAPIASPPRCSIVVPPGPDGKTIEVAVHDISLGGIAVMAPPDGIPFEEGVRYDDCRIDLPGIGPITVSIEMRYAIEIARPNGKNVRRSGFAFVRLRPESSHRIQRYMMQLQRARIAVR